MLWPMLVRKAAVLNQALEGKPGAICLAADAMCGTECTVGADSSELAEGDDDARPLVTSRFFGGGAHGAPAPEAFSSAIDLAIGGVVADDDFEALGQAYAFEARGDDAQGEGDGEDDGECAGDDADGDDVARGTEPAGAVADDDDELE